jgi:hypothetical protein
MQRVAAYIGDNLGALAGNLLFGFLLGGTTLFGLLVGLPIDIRHVAFSSAFVGIALSDSSFADPWLFVWAVSASPRSASSTSRSASRWRSMSPCAPARFPSPQWKSLARAVLAHLVRQPRDFFLPPRKATGLIRRGRQRLSPAKLQGIIGLRAAHSP